MSNEGTQKRLQHWTSTPDQTIIVLIVWFIFSLVSPWFAGELESMNFLGFKLGYYIIGMPVILVCMVVVSLLTPAPSEGIQRMVEEVQVPSGKTILDEAH